jgi:hypothetical protein
LPTCRLWTCHAVPTPCQCRVHAVPTPCPAMALRSPFRTACSWHGACAAWALHGMCESYTAVMCKSNGKDTIPLTARHGRGTAWARHGNGMVCVN